MRKPGKYDLPATLAQNLSAVSMQIQTPYLKYFRAMIVSICGRGHMAKTSQRNGSGAKWL